MLKITGDVTLTLTKKLSQCHYTLSSKGEACY